MELTFRIASAADVEPIAALVNLAYRPTADRQGWTHEGKLVAGDRTTSQQVRSLFGARSVILVLCRDAVIVACVNLQIEDTEVYIGMLATKPALQAQGIGKKMLRHAEEHAKSICNPTAYKMSVLTSRPELIGFYERQGYKRTGEMEGYPLAAGIGRPLVADLQVEMLVKQLTPLAAKKFR